MNSKERVQAAIARQPVDQVPLGFYAVDHDTVERVIGRPTFVRNKIDVPIALWEGRREEVAAGLKADVVEFYRKIDCADLLLPKEAQLLPPRDHDPDPPRRIGTDEWEDSQGRIFRAVRHVNEIQCVHDPKAGEWRQYRVEDFPEEVEATPPDPSVFEVFDHVLAELGDTRYVAGPTAGFTAITLLGGTEQGLMRHATEPEVVLAASRHAVARQNQLDAIYIRPGVPGVLMEQDMAGSNGPLISPDMFRRMALPFMKERVRHVKEHVPQVIFHNCGNNIPLMDMFIETGVDCYQSLQTTAGMEVGLLKEKYGDRLCFWGGVPLEVLIQGTPAETRQAVRTAMERGAPGGGFMLGPSHSVAKNTQYDNFMAMLDEFVALRDKF
jgi:uroporphyrinogen decarboxylase